MDLLASSPTISVTANRDYFLLRFPDSWVTQVKEKLPGIHRDRERGCWLAPVNSSNADMLRRAASFTWTDDAKGAAAEIYFLEEMRQHASKSASADLVIPNFHKNPYPYQKAGILYAVDRKRVIIGDDMGLGKTLQALGTMEYTQAYPALIVVPPGLEYNWAENEIAQCMPHRKVVVANKKTGLLLLRMADIVVTTYTQLIGFRNYKNSEGKMTRTSFTDTTKKDVILSELGQNLLKINFRSGAWDEAHRLKDGSTAQTMASEEMRKAMEYVLLLTGTACMNNAKELASLLRFLDVLDQFGGWWHFMSHYGGMKKTKFGYKADEAHNTDELNRKLRATCFIRRLKKEVLTELPDKTRGSILVEIDNQDEYDHAEAELIQWVRDRVRKREEFLASIAHLPAELKELAIRQEQDRRAEAAEKAEAIVKINALMNITARGKLKFAHDWIKEFLLTDEKLIVFAKSRECINQLIKWFPTAARIISDDDGRMRQDNVTRFQTDPACRLIIGAMGTSAASSPAGVGHNLTAASNTLHLEMGWNAAHQDQQEDRAWRNGQKNNVTCHYLLGRDTIDKDTAEIIENKRQLAKQVLDGAEAILETSILDDLLARYANK